MKKILLMLALFSAVATANAQIATENSNALDNISVGINAGASVPLDFTKPFDNVNPMFGVTVEKLFSPIFGLQLEGTTWLQDHNKQYLYKQEDGSLISEDGSQTVSGKWFKAINVGLNSKFNLSNLFSGYNGKPRVFEVSTIGGLGALFYLGNGEFLTAKTGLDFAFNLGKSKASSLVISPAIYWNLSGNHSDEIHFNKSNAQFALMASYVYHFKNSNGTHYFKTYDVGAMNNEINYLRGKLDECEKREPKVVEKIVEAKTSTTDAAVVKNGNSSWVVTFATASSVLTNEAKFILNQVGNDAVVDVTATASPDGSREFNQRLSEKRAAVVADYLSKRGVKVNSFAGMGVSAESGRSAVVKTVQ